MQTSDHVRATDWMRERPRTLIAKDGAVRLWPGIPLAMERDGTIQPLPRDWVRPWITALHGFEAQHAPLEAALTRAAHHLTQGNQRAAQAALDTANIDRLSPEGGALMRTIAGDLGIAPIAMPIGSKSLPWGAGDHAAQRALFIRFGNAAPSFEKAGNPDQPRWPKYAPDSQGGRYAPGNAEGGSPDSAPGIGHNCAPPDELPGMGHNGGPRLDDLPDMPEEEPSTVRLTNNVIRSLAVWLAERGVVALIPGIGEAAAIVQLGVWLYQFLPYLDAYIQPPQSLEDLENAANDPQPGYQIHHIVEQKQAANEGYPRSEIDAPENLVRISTLKHWQISNWYSRANPEEPFNGQTPRNYLRGKDWAEKVKIGRGTLIRFGVLKP